MASVFVADKGREVTNLFDIGEQSQFEALYHVNGLHGDISLDDAIEHNGGRLVSANASILFESNA